MPQLLLIDDDPLIGRTLVDLLALHGYEACRAESAEAGLEALAGGGFDLVLLDVRLPGMSGFDACARIREAHGPHLPVVMMTAFGDPAAVRRGYESGADDFLHKPIDTPALILKVRAFLRLKSTHDELARSREEAQARARDLARLHEIGRDWSLIAEPAEFYRMVTQRLSALIGAPIVGVALHDPATRCMEAALPVHGLPEDRARAFRYVPRPEYRSLWSPRSGRPCVINEPGSDPRLAQEIALLAEAQSVVLVPLFAEGELLGLLGAADKPGGFTEADVQLLSTFAGPVATFLRGRQSYDRERRQAARFERMAALVGDMAAVSGRRRLLELTAGRVQSDLGFDHVAFYAAGAGDSLVLEAEAGATTLAGEAEAVRWALRLAGPLEVARSGDAARLAVPVRAGERPLGVLTVAARGRGGRFDDEQTSVLSTLAGHLALALQRAESEAATEHLARQMATLYDLGLETAALRDLQALVARATEEAGRLIGAEHSSVFRYDEREQQLRRFAVWSREPEVPMQPLPTFRVGEGLAGRVARDLLPILVDDASSHPDFARLGHPVARLVCVPLTHYDRDRGRTVLYGVLNATRPPGSPVFTEDDRDYLQRFAGQLSIAIANSVAFEAQRERSEQLALVNSVLRETAAILSRERILETAVRRIHEHFRPSLVAMLVPERDLFRVAAAAGPARDGWTGGAVAEGAGGRALRERRTVVAGDAEPGFVPRLPGSRSAAALPIVCGGDVAAVLLVEDARASAFDRGALITLETLGDGIGILLRTAELYEALESTNARLVELDRTKSELVNVVAHDFRAPLAAILGWAELLTDSEHSAEVRERARWIVESAQRMAALMDRTLESTRLETGQLAFDFGLVDLSALLRETAERLPRSPAHPLLLDLPEEPLPCWADGDRIVEVVENLLSNAVKYSPAGGEVRLGATREREQAVVSVTDHGIGIAPESLPRLFRPFSRVHDRQATGIEGFGLGLSICERFVRAHGGRFDVKSVPRQGSVFSFTLPLYGARAQARGPVVVIAVAEAGMRRELRRVAEELGFAVQEAVDGVEAVEAVTRLRPVAAVLDRILPRLRAEDVAERLRLTAATSSVPLLAVADPADLGSRAALFRGFLARPLDGAAVAEALSAVAARPAPTA
jgi:signal transduction histidine kinase/DNA-binding response OmpR family regulator